MIFPNFSPPSLKSGEWLQNICAICSLLSIPLVVLFLSTLEKRKVDTASYAQNSGNDVNAVLKNPDIK